MNKPSPLLVLVDQRPLSGDAVRERVDLVIMALALDLPLNLVFVGDGVWQLLADQAPQTLDLHDATAAWRSLDLYGLEQVWVDGDALRARGLTTSQLMLPVTVAETRDLQALLASSGSAL